MLRNAVAGNSDVFGVTGEVCDYTLSSSSSVSSEIESVDDDDAIRSRFDCSVRFPTDDRIPSQPRDKLPRHGLVAQLTRSSALVEEVIVVRAG